MKENLKILIVDRETLVHSGLKAIINEHWTDIIFLTEVNTDVAPQEVPDLLILGTISGNKATGIKQIKRLTRRFPSSRILIFTTLDEWTYAIPYLKAGARGYLSKSADDKTMVVAINTILEGRHLFCSEKLREQLYSDFFLSYLNGNQKKRFVTKEGLDGYKGGRKNDLPETKK